MIAGIILMISLTTMSGCIFYGGVPGSEVKESFDEVYTIGNTTHLSISTINGAIKITSWENESLFLNVTKRSRYGHDDLDNAELVVSTDGNEFSIMVYNKQPVNNRAIDLVVFIPQNMNVSSVLSTNGVIHIVNTSGNMRLSTTNGPINGERIDGIVTASSTNGFINLSTVTSVGDLLTTNGRIRAELFELQNDVNIQSTNGDIILYATQTLNATVNIQTTNGDIFTDESVVSILGSTGNQLNGIIGSAGYALDIITVNGDISIYRYKE